MSPVFVLSSEPRNSLMLPTFQSIALLIRREDNLPHNTPVRVGTGHNCTIVEPFDHYHPRRDVTRENCSTATHTYEASRFDDDTYHILRCKNPVRKSTPRPCHQAQGTIDDCHRQGRSISAYYSIFQVVSTFWETLKHHPMCIAH